MKTSDETYETLHTNILNRVRVERAREIAPGIYKVLAAQRNIALTSNEDWKNHEWLCDVCGEVAGLLGALGLELPE